MASNLGCHTHWRAFIGWKAGTEPSSRDFSKQLLILETPHAGKERDLKLNLRRLQQMKHIRSLISFNLTPKEIARFYSQIDLDNKRNDECWLWKGKPMPGKNHGYGRFAVIRNRKTTALLAHRVAFFLYWGVDPEEYLVCHECDTPLCCNPNCLFIGTQFDNMRDSIRKRRRGNRTKLTEKEVLEIRSLHNIDAMPSGLLAKKYGIQQSHVCSILSRRIWRNI